MTHFAIFLPDWNAIDSVRRAHSDLEAGALVFFALLVVFEASAHLSEDKKKERLFDKIGLFFFALAVFAEIAAYPYGQRNDTLSGQMIGSLSDEAGRADAKAKKALTDSGAALSQANDALTKSGKAEDSLGKAKNEADTARLASSDALTLARGARQEADSFEKDIVSAKEAAAGAEAKLADRTLTEEQQKTIADNLKGFAGQEYKVVAYWDSPESLGIANRIHQSLQMAHWTYLPPPATGVVLLGGTVGVQIWHHPDSDDSTKRAAQALISFLNAAGIVAYEKVENPTNNPKHNFINLNVGSKR